MLGVHLDGLGRGVARCVRRHDHVRGARVALGGTHGIPAILVRLEHLTVVGHRHGLVAVVNDVKGYALAVGAIPPDVIDDGGVGVFVGVGLNTGVEIFDAADSADLLARSVSLGRRRRNDLVLPPAAPTLSDLTTVLAGLIVPTRLSLLPLGAVGHGVRSSRDRDLAFGRLVVVVVSRITNVIGSARKAPERAVGSNRGVRLAIAVAILHGLGHARDGTVTAAARGPIITHKARRSLLVCLGDLNGLLASDSQVVGRRHAIPDSAGYRVLKRGVLGRPVSVACLVLDLQIIGSRVVLDGNGDAVLLAVIDSLVAQNLKVEASHVENLP